MIFDRWVWWFGAVVLAGPTIVLVLAVLRGYHLHMTRPGDSCPQCGRRD